jgi:hypothetical protein
MATRRVAIFLFLFYLAKPIFVADEAKTLKSKYTKNYTENKEKLGLVCRILERKVFK